MPKKEIIVMICIAAFFTAFMLVFILLPNGEERVHAKGQSRNMSKTITQNLRTRAGIIHYQTSKGLECVIYGSMSGGVGISCNWAVYNTPQNYNRKN